MNTLVKARLDDFRKKAAEKQKKATKQVEKILIIPKVK